jgi:hypothetical protein
LYFIILKPRVSGMGKKKILIFGIALVLLFTGIALATSSASSDVEIYAFDQIPAGSDRGMNGNPLQPSNENVDIGNGIL